MFVNYLEFAGQRFYLRYRLFRVFFFFLVWLREIVTKPMHGCLRTPLIEGLGHYIVHGFFICLNFCLGRLFEFSTQQALSHFFFFLFSNSPFAQIALQGFQPISFFFFLVKPRKGNNIIYYYHLRRVTSSIGPCWLAQ